MAEYVLPIAQRRNLIARLKIGEQIIFDERREGTMSPPVCHEDAEKVARLPADPHFEAIVISHYHLHDFHFSNREAAVVRSLPAFLRERGVEAVIFHPPVQALCPQPDCFRPNEETLVGRQGGTCPTTNRAGKGSAGLAPPHLYARE